MKRSKKRQEKNKRFDTKPVFSKDEGIESAREALKQAEAEQKRQAEEAEQKADEEKAAKEGETKGDEDQVNNAAAEEQQVQQPEVNTEEESVNDQPADTDKGDKEINKGLFKLIVSRLIVDEVFKEKDSFNDNNCQEKAQKLRKIISEMPEINSKKLGFDDDFFSDTDDLPAPFEDIPKKTDDQENCNLWKNKLNEETTDSENFFKVLSDKTKEVLNNCQTKNEDEFCNNLNIKPDHEMDPAAMQKAYCELQNSEQFLGEDLTKLICDGSTDFSQIFTTT